MKTLIKILCLSVFTFVIANEKNEFYDQDIFQDNVTIILKDSKSYEQTTILSIDSKYIIFKTQKFEQPFRIDINKVKTVKTINGTVLYEPNKLITKKVLKDEIKDSLITNDITPFISNESLIYNSGIDLEAYRNKYYLGLLLQIGGTAIIVSGTEDSQILGGILSLFGSILQLTAVNDVGEAGEKLQKVKDKNK